MAAAAAPDPLLPAARLSVTKACDGLLTRQTLFNTFDEMKGAREYVRWRRDLISYVSTAGPDFVAALKFPGVLPPAADYTDALVAADTADSRPVLTMPQMRQHALLAVMRATLSPDGDSIAIIRACVHAGGIVQVAGVNHDQALKRLDKRWGFTADAPDVVPKDLPATPDMAASEATVAAAVEDAAEAVAGGVKFKS